MPYSSFCLLINVVLITLIDSHTLFVSENGWDHYACGTEDEACGTLYFSSLLANAPGFELYINGQNTSQIRHYANNTNVSYHPCLPIPFDYIINITITFNKSLIHDMRDWYPQICTNYDLNNASYHNKCMFEAFDTALTINNLQIDLNQYTNVAFGLINVMNAATSVYNGGLRLECNECHFRNIYNNMNHTNALFMIYSIRSIHLNHCSFTNIHNVNEFIVLETLYFTMYNVTVRDSTFNPTFVTIENPDLDYYEETQNIVSINACEFVNISSEIAIINEDFLSCDLTINNVAFIHIHNGGVYHSKYVSNAQVNMDNIYLSTSQTTKDYTLFDFYYSPYVNINNMTVVYNYDIMTNCREGSVGFAEDNETWLQMQCENVIALIDNLGSTMSLSNIDLYFSVTENDTHYDYDYDYVYMIYDNLETSINKDIFITNNAYLSIYNLNIYALPFNAILIKNFGTLNIDEYNVIMDNYTDFDPNALQSSWTIDQIGQYAVLNVSNSQFIGGYDAHIFINSGSATIYNTIFQFSGNAIYAIDGEDIQVSHCTFNHLGRYWVNINLKLQSETPFYILNFNYVDHVIVEWNDLSGYEDQWQGVFILAQACDEVILRDNTFALQLDEGSIYDVIPYIDAADVTGLLYFWENYNVFIYRNDFYKNDLNPYIPWLYLYNNAMTSCLSGNNFTNYAFYLYYGTITSCFRKELYLCIDNDCSDGSYGNINTEFYDVMSHINIDASFDLESFFTAYYSKFTLDNVQFNILNNEPWDWVITYKYGYYFSFLILDSIFPPNVSIYQLEAFFIVTDHIRLNNTNYIAKLRCYFDVEYNVEMWNITTSIPDAEYTDHLSATQIHFNATSDTYFPGQKLKFDHNVYDKLGNIANYYSLNDTNISNPSISAVIIGVGDLSLGWNQNISIQDDGLCEICDTGVIILGVALYDVDYIRIISMKTSIVSNNLVSVYTNITLSVTSCPVGYGPDENQYQCHICPDDTYNLLPNNDHKCQPCDEENNVGVICTGGKVYVLEDYWLGFIAYNNSMVTAICPSLYCCDQSRCDYYNEALTLCATNRNSSVPLCGKCINGFTESGNSPECMQCDNEWWWWLFKPIFLSILYTGYLLAFNPKKSDQELFIADNERKKLERSSSRWARLKARCTDAEFLILAQSLALRVLLFYEQALGDILWPSTTISYLGYIYTVTSIFSLETNIVFADTDPKCYINGLTSKYKILLGLLPWSIITVWLCIIFSFEQIRLRIMPKTTCKLKICNANFAKAFMSLLILCVSQLLSVLFKLLNCQRIGTKSVHFYFGEEECFATPTMVISIIFVVLVGLVWIILWLLLHKKTPQEREHKNSYAYNLCKYYKKDCYFWEFVLLIRRAIISLYAILYTSTWFATILVAILFFFLTIHNKYEPFKMERVNNAEYYSLCLTILVITIQTTTTTSIGAMNDATAIVLSFLIIVPVIIIFGIIFHEIWNDSSYIDANGANKVQDMASSSQEKMPLKVIVDDDEVETSADMVEVAPYFAKKKEGVGYVTFSVASNLSINKSGTVSGSQGTVSGSNTPLNLKEE